MCRERTVALAQVAAAERAKVVYVYDFGDDWRHDVVVEKIVPAEPGVAYPRCTGGRRAAPREDCGGIWAFNEYQADWEDTFDAGEVTARLTGLAEVLIPASSLRSMTGHYFAKRYSGPPNFAGLPAGAGKRARLAVAHHGESPGSERYIQAGGVHRSPPGSMPKLVRRALSTVTVAAVRRVPVGSPLSGQMRWPGG